MNKTIDYNLLKVFLTLFVVLGHITRLYSNNWFDFLEPNKITGFITGAIYSFHMPFFIFISGCIYGICLKSGKYANYASMLKNKSKRLLLPYIFIALFFLAPVLCLNGTKYHYADYLLNGVLLGKAPHHLWFLLSLFTMFLLIRIIEKFLSLRSRIVCVVMIVLLSFFNSQIRIVYFQVEMTLHYFIYFYIGYLFEYENIKNKILKVRSKWLTYLLPLGIVLLFVISLKTWGLPTFHFFVDYILAFLVIFYVVNTMNTTIRYNSIYTLIKRNTFGIYLFHIPVVYLFYYYCRIDNPCVMIPVAFVLSTVLSIVITELTRKVKLNFMIGEF